MISHLTEERGDGPDEPPAKPSGVGIVTNGDGQIYLTLSAPDDDLVDFWEINELEARNLAKMISAFLGEV